MAKAHVQVEQVGDASIGVVPFGVELFGVELFGVEPILDLSTFLEKRFVKSMLVSRLDATSLEESMLGAWCCLKAKTKVSIGA
jgi:hypothetical protein